MNLTYTVSKEKGGQWYGFPGMIDGCKTFGDKKNALHDDDGLAVHGSAAQAMA